MKMLRLSILCLLILMGGVIANAQSSAYKKAMIEKVSALDAAELNTFESYADEFSRYASIEGSDWCAEYYAAYCRVIVALKTPKRADELCHDAELSLDKAEERNGNLSEILCLRSMIATARLLVDPQTRWQSEGAKSGEMLRLALEQNQNNPRVYYLMAQSLYNTPAQFGGGKEKALPLLEKALSLFEAEKVDPEYAPHWGKIPSERLAKACK